MGSEWFSEIMCAAVGVRRAQRRQGRPMAKSEQNTQVEDQADFAILNGRNRMRKLIAMLTPLIQPERRVAA